MKSVRMRSTKPERKTLTLKQQSNGPARGESHALPISPCEDLNALIAKRAHELYRERGYRDGSALNDWLDAEREILSQIPPV